ncbi:MAG: helix-turn-helix domain-containing protein [Chloroflexi bacterium]|nr:helix-turn-helix domain-containing protein [Chloroflexota bacterium]
MLAQLYPPPNIQDSEIAREATARIVPFVRTRKPLEVRIVEAENQEPLVLPAGAVALLKDILEAMASGHSITMIPHHAELTTVEAADILNVSRPYLIKLLEAGEIRFRKVGTHRRILMEELMAYKEKSERRSRAAMDELVALSEELGLYDL